MDTKQELLNRMRQDASEWETPGLWDYVAQNPQIRTWLDSVQRELNGRLVDSTEDEYELLTSSYLRGVKKAARMHSDAEWAKLKASSPSLLDAWLDLDLRFARYIEFCVVYKMYRTREHEKKAPYRMKEVYDDYLLFGAPPLIEPDSTVFWGTAQDWWVALRDPLACAAIKLFRRLPLNERSRPPELGEVVTRMDFTNVQEDGRPMIKTERVNRVQRSLF